jgi:hypothetical protein
MKQPGRWRSERYPESKQRFTPWKRRNTSSVGSVPSDVEEEIVKHVLKLDELHRIN